jgi:hypothetical protein
MDKGRHCSAALAWSAQQRRGDLPYETRSQRRDRQSYEVEQSQHCLRESIEQAKRLLDKSEALLLRHRDHEAEMLMRHVISDAS